MGCISEERDDHLRQWQREREKGKGRRMVDGEKNGEGESNGR